MLSTHFAAGAAVLLSMVASSTAFDATAKNNVAMYYGQGPYEGTLGLAHFCQAANAPDIIPLGFINRYLAQGNGYPGSNFGSSCGAGVYKGPGYNGVVNAANNQLLSDCGTLRSSIATCQSLGKKILLSLGGSTATYKLNSNTEAHGLADFLWYAFGPGSTSWKGPRPFDYNGKYNVIDGFDFDIEHTASGEQAYYVVLINALQAHYATYYKTNPTSKKFLITGAPQCSVVDQNMGSMILQAKFDMLFVQFYNTAACSARTWVTANPKYASTRREYVSGFSYDNWLSYIKSAGSKSNAAKIFIGLPGNSSAAVDPSYYLSVAEMKPLLEDYWCHGNFGGVMLWEAMYAEQNSQGNYYQAAKSVLNGFAAGTSSINCATVVTSKLPSPTPSCGGCATTYTVAAGNTCSGIAAKYGLTMAQFTALNPKWTAATCPSLQIGTVVCVKAQAACKKRSEPASAPAIQTLVPQLRRHAHAHAHAHAHDHKH